MFINTHQSKEVNMSKKREEEPNPLLGELLEGIFQYKEKQSPEALQLIDNAIDKGANSLHNLCFGETPFSLATRYGLTKVVELMIAKNVDPNNANSLGILNLPGGQSEGYTASVLHVAVAHKQPEVAKNLLQHMGCSFNSNNKFSPLHVAALQKNHNLFNILVEGGCDPNAQDFMIGKTAYEWVSHFNFDNAKE